MKKFLLLALPWFFVGCVSLPPKRSRTGWPVAAIVVPKEQTIILPTIGHPVVTLPAGRYTLVYQNKMAWFYSFPDCTIAVKDLFDYRGKGGIVCDKITGWIAFYRISERDQAGELVRYFAKKELGDTDDVVRVSFGPVNEKDYDGWEFVSAARASGSQ